MHLKHTGYIKGRQNVGKELEEENREERRNKIKSVNIDTFQIISGFII